MTLVRTSIVIALFSVLPASLVFGQNIRVTLLGSGKTFPQQGRLGPNVLIEAGDKTYIFGTGRSVLQRFAEINQSHELHHAYKEHDLQVQFEVVHGAAHGGELFRDEKRNALVEMFLDEQLR